MKLATAWRSRAATSRLAVPEPRRLRLARFLCRRLPPLCAQRVRELIYPRHRAWQDGAEVLVPSQTGSRLHCRTGELHGYVFAVHGYKEWRSWALALAVCRPGDTIVEIGANVGTETVGFADIVGPRGKVYAFEPSPENVAALQETVRLNGFVQVAVHAMAVADCCGELEFVVSGDKHNSGVGHLLVGEKPRGSAAIRVPCATLDVLSDTLGSARAIFIDAEGSELRILRGGRDYLRQHRPVLVVEASQAILRRSGLTVQDLHGELRQLRYHCYQIHRFGLRPVDPQRAAGAANWFCAPAEEPGLPPRGTRMILLCGLLPCVSGSNPLTRARGQ